MAGKSRKSKSEIDFLMRDPLVKIRMHLASVSKAGLDSEQYNAFLERIEKEVGGKDLFADLRVLAQEYFETGEKFEGDLHLADPRAQLFWSATLIHLMTDYQGYHQRWAEKKAGAQSQGASANDNTATGPAGKPAKEEKIAVKPLGENELYKRLLNDRVVKKTMLDYAFQVNKATKNPSVRFKWGMPGTWFYFSPQDNNINIDLLQTMIGGFHDTLSIVLHEVGHSQLTLAWPPEQQKMIKELEPFTDKIKKKQKLTQEEYKRYRVLSKELQLRHRVTDACENAPVNRYAASRKGRLGTAMRKSLNRIFMEVSGGGLLYMRNERNKNTSPEERAMQEMQKQLEKLTDQIPGMKDKKKSKKRHDEDLIPADGDPNTNQAKFQNVIWVINTVFYQNNRLFGARPSDWEKVGVRPHDIQLDPDIREDVLEQFPNAKKHWNPDLAVLIELCGGKEGLENLQPNEADKYKFGKDYFNVQADYYMDRRNELNQNIWDWYMKKLADEQLEEEEEKAEQDLKDKQDQDGQDGQDQDGEGQDGQDQDGEGQDGQEQDGQQQKGKGKGKGKGQKGEKGEPQEGQGGGGDEQSEDEDTVEVEGAGDMPNPNPVDEDDPSEQGKGKDKDGQDADGEGQEADGEGQDADGEGQDKGKTLEELMEEMDGDGDEPGQEADGDAPPGSSSQGGKDNKRKTLEEMAAGSFANYHELVKNLQPEINKVARALENLRKKQLQKEARLSKSNHTLTPEYNDISRLNRDRHINKAKQTNPTLEDRKVFRTKKKFDAPSDFEFTLGVDGSASMLGNERVQGGNGYSLTEASPLKFALMKAIVFYEACRLLNQNAYVYIWGNQDPIMLAEPGDSHHKIAENIMRVEKEGLNCGTEFLPAVQKIVKRTAFNRKRMRPLSGYTHHLVFSDGDVFGNKDAVISRCEELLNKGLLQTMDFDIIRKQSAANSKPPLIDIANCIQSDDPRKRVGYHLSTLAKLDIEGTLGMIIEKMVGKPVRAVPTAKKKKSLQRISMSWEP